MTTESDVGTAYWSMPNNQNETITVEVVDDSDDEVTDPSHVQVDVSDTSGNPPRPPPFAGIPPARRSFQQMVCLAGLPRAGGTLLTALLGQNPKIHTEGHSPLCQLMWDTYLSYQDKCNREFASNGKDHMLPQIIGQIPHSYYQDVSAGTEVVVDRCRSWCHEFNMNMLRGCVDPNIKVIIMERPIQEVMESYARILSKNHMGSALDQVLPQLLQPNTEPILRAMEGIRWAKMNNQGGNFLVVTYEELVTQPQATMDKIYAFCGWAPFQHDFNYVTMRHPENDQVHGLIGQYDVHPKVGKRWYVGTDRITLPDKVMETVQDIKRHFDI